MAPSSVAEPVAASGLPLARAVGPWAIWYRYPRFATVGVITFLGAVPRITFTAVFLSAHLHVQRAIIVSCFAGSARTSRPWWQERRPTRRWPDTPGLHLHVRQATAGAAAFQVLLGIDSLLASGLETKQSPPVPTTEAP